MKREALNVAAAVLAVLLLAVGGPWLVGELRALPGTRPLAARANQRAVALEVSGMTCPACAARIHDQLAATPGVSACAVRTREGRAYVVCDRALPDSALTGAVRRAGPGYLAAVSAR